MAKPAQLNRLRSAITTAAARPTLPAPADARGTTGKHPGEVLVGAWCKPAYRQSLMMVRAKIPEKNNRTLITEALNDLFAKYNVPTVSEK